MDIQSALDGKSKVDKSIEEMSEVNTELQGHLDELSNLAIIIEDDVMASIECLQSEDIVTQLSQRVDGMLELYIEAIDGLAKIPLSTHIVEGSDQNADQLVEDVCDSIDDILARKSTLGTNYGSKSGGGSDEVDWL